MTPDAAASHDLGQAVQHWDSAGVESKAETLPGVILICEHASDALVSPWVGVAPGTLASHAGCDLGALGLGRALARLLAPAQGGAELIHAPFSRVIYDLNRSPDREDACPVQSEIYPIDMNRGLTPAARLERVRRLYLPFHDLVRARIARALALGRRPVILTVHSFSPVWHGVARRVEFGVIHDTMPALAQQIVALAAGSELRTALNEPYSAADHVTHTLRLHALPYGLDNAMLEIRNDLITTAQDQAAMAARLAPILHDAIAQVSERACLAS